MVIVLKVLFDVKLEDFCKNSLYVYVEVEEGKIFLCKIVIDVVYDIIVKMKKDGYIFFIDDNCVFNEKFVKNFGICIVVCNVVEVKYVVEKLGCFIILYFDYSLDIYEDGEIIM